MMNGYVVTTNHTNGINSNVQFVVDNVPQSSHNNHSSIATYYHPRHDRQYQLSNTTASITNQATNQHQHQRPQVNVVIGTGSGGAVTSSSRTNPNSRLASSMCCDCVCSVCPCLATFWYHNCNIYRVIALICNLFVDLLMILCLLSTNWLTTTKYRQGLWQYCIEVDSPRPLPFGLNDHDGCHWGRDVAYIKLSGFFAVSCFVLALIATVLTSCGLSSRDPNRKYTFYRFALYINLAALLAIIVSLTLYPAFFYTELHHTNAVPVNRPHWYFGWAYGVGWGSSIFLVGAILLLVCDKETEEIYYKERTIVHTNQHHTIKA